MLQFGEANCTSSNHWSAGLYLHSCFHQAVFNLTPNTNVT